MLTLAQVAKLASVSLKTVRRWIGLPAGRGLRVVRLSARCLRVRQADWEQFQARRTV